MYRLYTVHMLLSCISLIFFTQPICMNESYHLSDKQQQFISKILEDLGSKLSFRPDFTFRYSITIWNSECNARLNSGKDFLVEDIVVWDPQDILQPETLLKCPSCTSDSPEILHAIRWKDGKTKHDMPRRLYGLYSDALLVSRVYICKNKHQILAHDPGILEQTRGLIEEPFFLFHRSGVTRELYNFAITHINAGMSIPDVQSLWHQTQYDTFASKKSLFEMHTSKFQSKTLDLPVFPKFIPKGENIGEKIITSCFVWSYFSRENLFNTRMSQHTAEWLSADHTFKVSANIGFWQNKKWVKMYDTLFIVLNEDGVVVAWQLCKGSKFETVETLLVNLYNRLEDQGKQVGMFFVDNCCQWGGLLKTVFPETNVKLDSFHAIQRIVRCVPKRGDIQLRSLRRQMLKSFKLIIRDPADKGKERTMPTPSADIIMSNIDVFIKHWRHVEFEGVLVLPKEAVEEIEKLKVHVMKGCLSGIPTSGGTNRNENLHKILNSAIRKARVGIQLAVALLGTFFYRWNEKILCGMKIGNRKKKIKVVAPVETYTNGNSICKETFGTRFCEPNCPADIDNLHDEQGSRAFNKLNDMLSEDEDKLTSNSETDSDNEIQENSKANIDLTEERMSAVLNTAKNMSELNEHIQKLGQCELYQHHHAPHFKSSLCLLSCPLDRVNSELLQLDEILNTYNMCRFNVKPDGNCFFASVAHGLQRVFVHNLISKQQRDRIAAKMTNVMDIEENTKCLRKLIVAEFLLNEEKYKPFLTNNHHNYHTEASLFLQDGFYASELGNSMPFAMSNVLGIPIIVFTGMQNMPVIPVCPDEELLADEEPLYLAYDHTNSGHYDAVFIKSDDSCSVETNKPHDNGSKVSSCSLTQTVCRCGQGAKKKSKDFISCNSYKSGCPCFQNVQGCSENCKCLKCGNKFGIRKENEPAPLATNTIKRKRRKHQISTEQLSGASFFTKREKTEPMISHWTMYEEIVLTELLQFMAKENNTIDSTTVYCQYCSIVRYQSAKSKAEKNFLTEKSVQQVNAKISKILSNDRVFQTLLKEQIRLNYF